MHEMTEIAASLSGIVKGGKDLFSMVTYKISVCSWDYTK